MRLTKEREAEIRERAKTHIIYMPCYECGNLYDHKEINELLAEIDYLRDSFLDMGIVIEAGKKERDQLREKLAIGLFALITSYDFIERIRARVTLNEPFYTLSGKAKLIVEEALTKIRGAQ